MTPTADSEQRNEPYMLHRTMGGVEVYVRRGRKSVHDFRVQYREPGKRLRTPKHIHLMIDLYMKSAGDRALTMQLVDYIINDLILKLKPADTFPPALQVFNEKSVLKFTALDDYGEYSVDFLLVLIELIMLQEKTNYPEGVMNLELFRKFREGSDIFSVVSAATFTHTRSGL